MKTEDVLTYVSRQKETAMKMHYDALKDGKSDLAYYWLGVACAYMHLMEKIKGDDE